ncbi:MAG TPA: cysteine synthase family protein [Thermoanaerobaculia bacterium]|nr:cysteine synthase family protein [Thermoanaerobaculia bacterium]
MTTTVFSPPSLLQLIGNTPLIRVGELYAKAEFANPSGSVKDRPAARIIDEGEQNGRLRHGKVILDATSGNTGIAYAMIGAARGYRVRLCIPANANTERKKLLQAYGAELVFTDPMEGADGAVAEARRILAADPSRYFYADQYNNPANWRAHYDTTGPEILAQTEGRVTHFVAGIGTSGTFVGTGRRLREHNRNVRLIAVQPDSALHGVEGLKHLASASLPGIYDPSLVDEVITISTEEAQATVRRLAREEGLLVGVSSGANVAAARRVVSRISEGVVVTILCDGGLRYLSERFWGTSESPDVTSGDCGRDGRSPQEES